MPFITINGASFHVQVDGSDECPALLLSNSLSSDLTMWDDQVMVWSKRFRVIRYDQRGHGRSAVPEGPYSIDQLGRDAVGVLDALGIEKAHWCGLSLGGMVGMWMLTYASDRIERAVLANTAAHMGPPELWNGRIETARRGGMEALVEPTIERWFPEHFRISAPDTMERMRAMILRTPVAGYQGCCAAIRDMDQRESIRGVSRPVLVIIGARDPATKPADGELIASSIAGAQKLTLDAAHISNIEQPDAFASAVLDFLSQPTDRDRPTL
ncbi:3-oxoadipate enol-lactonase [Microvirga roseola]|uniref:3-oxoadipate enol-lactonase n=1 Tax=Microvirga roseola TaxID=2883126 RepID=UPI001E5A85DA|nr:3-oxoadipate enol-lactonase [Microvirga roseola]